MKDVEIVQIVNGQRMAERIPVTSLGERRYRLEGSPALIQGLAASDEIELESEGFRLLKRGGNVCAQIVMRNVRWRNTERRDAIDGNDRGMARWRDRS